MNQVQVLGHSRNKARCDFSEVRSFTRLGKTVQIFYHCRGIAVDGSCFCKVHDFDVPRFPARSVSRLRLEMERA
jgi:hypothetical protein